MVTNGNTKRGDYTVTSLRLHGGCTFCNVQLKSSENNYAPTNDEIRSLTTAPFKDRSWDKDTVLCINFNNNQFSGSNFEGDFGNIKYFKIYKKLGEQPRLHKVLTTTESTIGTVEDFTVGCACPYTYYVYPVCDYENGTERLGNVMQSEPMTLNDGIIRVIGLVQDENNFDTYYIDMDNIWHIDLNVSNTGFTNNMAKSYIDTQHQYPKEVKGNGNYRTIPIEGLLGKYDCKQDKYIDTYDDIIEWEQFMNNNELKMVIDLRGIITLGAIDSNSFAYQKNMNHAVSVNFTFKQLEDIDNVNILNSQLSVNPLEYNMLADNKPTPLKAHEEELLTPHPFLAVPKE